MQIRAKSEPQFSPVDTVNYLQERPFLYQNASDSKCVGVCEPAQKVQCVQKIFKLFLIKYPNFGKIMAMKTILSWNHYRVVKKQIDAILK